MSDLHEAMWIAFEAFDGQKDDDDMPKILHSLRVMMDDDLTTTTERIVAILHDVIEDCPQWEVNIKARFDTTVLAALHALNHPSSESYGQYISRVCDNYIARCVKIADIRDNTQPARIGKIKDAVRRQRMRDKYEDALKVLMK